MPVIEYLAQARASAELADNTRNPEDRKKILAISKAWAELAKTAAERAAAKPNDKTK
jgi:hypothetical protein